jgi:hypothetical protein
MLQTRLRDAIATGEVLFRLFGGTFGVSRQRYSWKKEKLFKVASATIRLLESKARQVDFVALNWNIM